MENGVKNKKKEGSNFRVKPANYMPKTQDKNLVQAETGRERERKREGQKDRERERGTDREQN